VSTLLEVAVAGGLGAAAHCEKGNSATAREQACSVELYTLVVIARLSTARLTLARQK
jgi:hypothetical protein